MYLQEGLKIEKPIKAYFSYEADYKRINSLIAKKVKKLQYLEKIS